MGTPSRGYADEVEVLREAYAALNRDDIPAFVAMFDPGIERIEPSDNPGGGIYRGLGAVEAHISKARSTWAEGGCEPERFIVAPPPPGDRIVVLVRVRVRLKHEVDWREGRTADVYTFRDGKVIEFRTFFDVARGLEWAGVKAGDLG